MARIKLKACEISPGRQWCAGRHMLQFAESGNLELWNRITRQLLWESGSKDYRAGKLVMQEDGNLVIYGRDDMPLWSSGTNGNPEAYLAVRDDGNLVIYSQDNRPVWFATEPVARRPVAYVAHA